MTPSLAPEDLAFQGEVRAFFADSIPEDWKTTVRSGLRLPPEVLQHRAVLSTPDGRPFSLVVETYRREILGFR